MKRKDFWITNITNKDLAVEDLGIRIRAMTSINLLDLKHYKFSIEQLENSQNSGSLFKKRALISVRQVAPEGNRPQNMEKMDFYRPSQKRSGVIHKPVVYDELIIPDDVYAEENADIVELDRKPLISK